MDEATVAKLLSANEEDACKILSKFASKNSQTFTFPTTSLETKQKIVTKIVKLLVDTHSSKCLSLSLEVIRILSRDKNGLESLASNDILALLLKHSNIESYAAEQGENVTIQAGDTKVVVEALKCLCNIIYNCKAAQKYCSEHRCVEGIVQRLKTYKDPDLEWDVKYFDMKVLFLLTALCADIRPRLRFELHGFTYLIEVLDLCLRDAEDNKRPLTDKDADLCCEVLKVLFNLTVAVDKTKLDEEEEAHFMRLVSVLHDLLLINTATKEKRDELQSHTVNLLTTMPRDCYEELLTPLNEGAVAAVDNKEVEYDGKNMEAVVILLDFLGRRLDNPSKSLKESLTPILHCMCETCSSNRCIRKFCRSKVLPPLRMEVRALPEEGNTLRNKLCRLLTSPIPEVKKLAADFLFVLCKENVGRMIKYTGYGNCAGLLASRGLLMGGRSLSTGDYSSDSEESDTEEYAKLKELVNPVTGRWELPKPDPLEGMSEEQKEYEAVELVKMMDKLCKEGIIKPSRIGEDGRPYPLEHVLQLTESMNTEPLPNSDPEDD